MYLGQITAVLADELVGSVSVALVISLITHSFHMLVVKYVSVIADPCMRDTAA